MQQLISGLGLFVMVGLAVAVSTDRRGIRWRPVLWGLGLQVVFAFLVLKTPPGRAFFRLMNDAVIKLLSFQEEGAAFVFNALALPPDQPGTMGFFFAFQVLTTIVFFSSLISVLYYLGIMQWVVRAFAVVMKKVMGTSGAETLSASANIFVGQTEAPLLIKPYVDDMTDSELMCVMVGGMATVAGGVMAAYVGMLKAYFPDIAGHLLAASVMSAPAALAVAKCILPESGEPKTMGAVPETKADESVNIIEAAANGATLGLQLALNVGTMLIAFMGLLALMNFCVEAGVELVTGRAGITLETILGWVFAPLAWLMGVEWADCAVVGKLMGEKTFLNEFVAYTNLGALLSEDPNAISHRSMVIATYALCGFANFLSIGIQIGGIGGIAPGRKSDLARLGVRALIGGTLAAFMTATIAGMLVG
jgi:CNT family concentrative nucleoside transporter